MRAEVVGQRRGHGVVARAAGSLAEGGEPTRSEVDRVEREQIGAHLGAGALEVVALAVEHRWRACRDLVRRPGALEDELVEEGRACVHLEAGQAGDLLGGIVALVPAQLGHLARANPGRLPEPTTAQTTYCSER